MVPVSLPVSCAPGKIPENALFLHQSSSFLIPSLLTAPLVAMQAFKRGNSFLAGGDVPAAMSSFQTAISLWGEQRSESYAVALAGIAHCYDSLDDNVAALSFTERALAVICALDQTKAATTHRTEWEISRGIRLSNLDRTTEGNAAFELALALAESAGNSHLVVDALTYLANGCQYTGEFEKGLSHLQRADSLLGPLAFRKHESNQIGG